MYKKFNLLETFFPIGSLAAIFTILLLQEDKISGVWSGTALRHLLGYIFFFAGLILVEIKVIRSKAFPISVVFLFLFIYCGIAQFLSTSLFLISAYCLGKQVINFFPRENEAKYNIAPSISIGLGLLVLFFGGLILTPYNNQLTYCTLLLAPIFLHFLICPKKDKIFCDINLFISSVIQNAENISPFRFYTFLFLLTYTLSFCLFPTITSDENAVHLSMWSQLTYNGQFVISPESQVWSAAPNTVSLIHGIVSLVAGADAKSAMNLCIFMLTIITIFRITKFIGLNSDDSTVIATLFISTPIIYILLIGLQTDLYLGLIFAASAMLLFSIEKNFLPSTLGVIFCGALALSSKLPGVLIAAPLVIAALIYIIRLGYYKNLTAREWPILIFLVALAVCIAIWPYAKAYYFTGNPFFPLYNKIFESPFFDPINFKDGRWDQGATFSSFLGLFFESKRFMEVTNNFVGGFQYFLLVPFAILLIFFKRKNHLIILALVALAYLIPIFFALQYLRYFYASLPILSVLIAIYFLKDASFYGKKLLIFAIYGTAFLNFLFSPGASWLFSISPFSFTKEGNIEKTIEDFMPEYYLNIDINKIKNNATVLFALNRSYGATLAGKPIYNTWYSSTYSKEIDSWASETDIANSLKRWEVDFIYWDQKHPYSLSDKTHNLIRAFLVKHGQPVAQVGSLIAFSVSSKENIFNQMFSMADIKNANVSGTPVVTADYAALKEGDVITNPINVRGYSSFKYSIKYICKDAKDIFIAQINWDISKPFYKILTCIEGENVFSEMGYIPDGSKSATVYLSARTNTHVKVNEISIGGK